MSADAPPAGNIDNVMDKVRQVLAEMLHVEPETILSDSNLSEDLGIDSFFAVELLFELEDRYELEIPDEDAREFRTVRDVAAYIVDRQSSG